MSASVDVMAKTQLNVRVDEETAQAARDKASERGISVNRYIEELVRDDHGESGRTFVEAAADFMKQYESIFAEEFGQEREGRRPNGFPDGPAPGTAPRPDHASGAVGGSATEGNR
jgi:HicB family